MKRIQMTDDQVLSDLKNTFGKEFIAADVRGYCVSKNISELVAGFEASP